MQFFKKQFFYYVIFSRIYYLLSTIVLQWLIGITLYWVYCNVYWLVVTLPGVSWIFWSNESNVIDIYTWKCSRRVVLNRFNLCGIYTRIRYMTRIYCIVIVVYLHGLHGRNVTWWYSVVPLLLFPKSITRLDQLRETAHQTKYYKRK